jgi:hypothetical protein
MIKILLSRGTTWGCTAWRLEHPRRGCSGKNDRMIVGCMKGWDTRHDADYGGQVRKRRTVRLGCGDRNDNDDDDKHDGSCEVDVANSGRFHIVVALHTAMYSSAARWLRTQQDKTKSRAKRDKRV